ncbi:SH3 domain-containing protein [Paracraurococcus lichenis]|uniref:SH3 domain-containing protein n=1 Tax=Paracraurococcus lichenis TaxID=3064888 RepID=A0ABT9DUM0_9PROT|nr:SH3 domain-containing protein [Paracraurococcus sp. LOR1-02]MDO9707596.1 SH3 domain-containing protein [Paracraurococcus sp. LOR1-02]
MIQQRERLYDLGQSGLSDEAARPPPARAGGLPPGWIGLEQCNISPLPGHVLTMPHVLLHPEVGVALIDLAPGETPGAEEAFRARLESARFAAIFPGTLPVVHLILPQEAPDQLGPVLQEAFAGLPPISLPGGDGWVSVVRRSLAQRMPGRAPVATSSLAGRQPPPMLNREVAAKRAGLASGAGAAATLVAAPPGGWRWPPIPVALGLAGLAAVASAAAVMWSAPKPAHPPVVAAAERSGTAAPTGPIAGGGTAAPVPSAAPAQPEAPRTASPASRAPDQVAAALTPVPPRDRAAPPAAAAAATPPPVAGPAVRVMVRAAANLRVNPNNTAPIIRTVPQGEVLREFSRSGDGWVEVGDTQPRGWIFSKLLVPPKP